MLKKTQEDTFQGNPTGDKINCSPETPSKGIRLTTIILCVSLLLAGGLLYASFFSSVAHAFQSAVHLVAGVAKDVIHVVEEGVEIAENKVVSGINFIEDEIADALKDIASILPGQMQKWMDEAVDEATDELHAWEKRVEAESLAPFDEWVKDINNVDRIVQDPSSFEEIAIGYIAAEVKDKLNNLEKEEPIEAIKTMAQITHISLAKYTKYSEDRMTEIVKRSSLINSLLEKPGVEHAFRMLLSEVIEPSSRVLEYMNWFEENWYVTFQKEHGWVNVKENSTETGITFRTVDNFRYRAGNQTWTWHGEGIYKHSDQGKNEQNVELTFDYFKSAQLMNFQTWQTKDLKPAYWTRAVDVDPVTGNLLFILSDTETITSGWTLDFLPLLDENGKEIRAIYNAKTKKWNISDRDAPYISRRIHYINGKTFWSADLTKNEQFFHSRWGMPPKLTALTFPANKDFYNHNDTLINYVGWDGQDHWSKRKQYHNNMTSITFVNKLK